MTNYEPTRAAYNQKMTRFYHMMLPGLLALDLMACGAPPAPPAVTGAAAEIQHERLGHLVERYWDESAAYSPWYPWGGAEMRFAQAPADTISPQALADSLARERRYLADLERVPRAPLDDAAKLTYDVFRRERELTIESFTYPAELLPVNGYDSVPQRFAVMAAAAEQQALQSDLDFDKWQSRARVFERWTAQAILNLREGMRRGYTLPHDVASRTLPVLAALGEDTPVNVLYAPLQAVSNGTDDQKRLSLAIAGVVKERLLPSYRALHDFMQHDYLPRSRATIGLYALPLGDDWYAFLAKRATGSTQTPAQLHAFGIAEVERLRARMQTLLNETAFAGNPAGFIDSMRSDPRRAYQTTDALLGAYEQMKTEVAAAIPTLFAAVPRAGFEIRGVEAFRAATSPRLFYRQSLAAGRYPAVLYVDADGIDARAAIADTAAYLREAAPGHLFQLALQQERADLPRFRQFGGAPAFIEGWGLYAASLGEEMGLYRDPQAKFGALLAELTCAAGTVIDTGIHAEQWTRAQALEYVLANVPLDEATAANVVDRDMALPGDALSCWAGYLKMKALRTRAEQRLGAGFDVQAFHEEVLKHGAVPLDLLDAEVKQWTEATASAQAAAKERAAAAVEEGSKLD